MVESWQMGKAGEDKGLLMLVADDAGWKEIKKKMSRRAVLFPNLVNTVKGFASQEKQVHTEVSEARSRLAGAGNPQQAPEAPRIELRAASR